MAFPRLFAIEKMDPFSEDIDVALISYFNSASAIIKAFFKKPLL